VDIKAKKFTTDEANTFTVSMDTQAVGISRKSWSCTQPRSKSKLGLSKNIHKRSTNSSSDLLLKNTLTHHYSLYSPNL